MNPFTLKLHDRTARLLDGAGRLLAAEPDLEALRQLLPRRAPVQLILAGSLAQVQCAEVPPMPRRELRDAARRLAPGHQAHALDADPLAEGGHVLWMASCPRKELDRWLDLLAQARARPVFALPWQRALLAAGPGDEPGALYLTVEPGAAHLMSFRGRHLRFTRTVPLPPEPDPRDLARAAGEELSLLLQFLQQKHRGLAPTALLAVGLPEAAVPGLEAVGRALGLPFTSLGPDLDAFLAEGADRERRRRGGLDLIPREVREARRRRLFRAVVWAALGGMVALGAGTEAFLLHHERILNGAALEAEAALAHRQALARAAAEAARVRFGLLRLRRAEARQAQAAEHLEQLGVRLLQAPRGMALEKVEITQAPGDPLADRFRVEGTARSGRAFSLDHLVDYYQRLAAFPGMKLEPLHDVAVQDGPRAPGLTRFHMEGSAP